jgi:hypothetical protein
MKSLAEQTVAELGGHKSVLSRQKRDHVELNWLLQRLSEVKPLEQGPVLRRIYRLVFPHAFAEESVLWPVLRRVLPDGHDLTLRVEREHQEITEVVAGLDKLPRDSPERQLALRQFVALLRQDVRDEEDKLLPRLQMKLTDRQLWVLGTVWEAVRLIAPTRSHALVARRPPGNVFSALPLSILDRSRDFVDAALDGRSSAATPILRALSGGLARVSDAVEKLPGMRLGEDGATRPKGKPGMTGRRAAVIVASASVMITLAHRRRQAHHRARVATAQAPAALKPPLGGNA